MALTIRLKDNDRKLLDDFKKKNGVATGSKALLFALRKTAESQSDNLSRLLAIIEAGNDIKVKAVPKRIDIEGGGRDWVVRFVWTVENDGFHECAWEGFETAAECVENLIKTLDPTNDYT